MSQQQKVASPEMQQFILQQQVGVLRCDAARAGCSQACLCACCLPWPCSAHCASGALGCRVRQLACCMHKPHGLLQPAMPGVLCAAMPRRLRRS